MTITIEKNIPIPLRAGSGRHCGKNTLACLALEVGDSFVPEGPPGRGGREYYGCAAKKSGFKFCSRLVDGKLRVWRIA